MDCHSNVEDLATDQEKAHTKTAYLIQHAANTNHDKDIVCVVRSNSGDINIPIILLGIELERNVHIYIDNGTGKNKLHKIIDISLLPPCQSNLKKHCEV